MAYPFALHHNLQTSFQMERTQTGGIKIAPLVQKFAVGKNIAFGTNSSSPNNFDNNSFPNTIPAYVAAVGDVFVFDRAGNGYRYYRLNRNWTPIEVTPEILPFFVDGTTRLTATDEVTSNWIADQNGGIKLEQTISVDYGDKNRFYLGDVLPSPSFVWDQNNDIVTAVSSVNSALYAYYRGDNFNIVYDGHFTVQSSYQSPDGVVMPMCRGWLGCYSAWQVRLNDIGYQIVIDMHINNPNYGIPTPTYRGTVYPASYNLAFN